MFGTGLILASAPHAELLYRARYTLYETTSVEVLAVHDRFTVCVGAGVPVPVSVAVIVGDRALLVIVNVALAVAAVCGLKVIVNAALCPDGIVTGRDRPPTLKAELFVLAAVTVTLPPLALRLPEALPLCPTTTLPNARVAGVTDN